ncbi:TetR/AcrR family transcriptional regulator [Roseovarius sp.]|uniref:TetR/AcrR family transcriptional regulator n=1 Tax=Roseovarius sp. TaxID=1486281 RepID=UPI002636EFCA|nr:TetR/AcrR family transcriptional regulator [Roseovarius sp.]MDM8167942.1 TetR/AcrR family transcriptional regulator [Roseovarius sp.]
MSTEGVNEKSANGFNFVDHLKSKLKNSSGLRKGERTRATLEIATAKILSESGYHDLRVTDICSEAGVANGTFYRYWKDTEAATFDTLTLFMATIRQKRPRFVEQVPLYSRLSVGHLYYISIYFENPGLMRCHFQLVDQLPKFAEMDLAQNIRIARRIVAAFENEGLIGTWPATADERMATALSCIASVDGCLRMISAYPDKLGYGHEMLANTFTNVWFRSFTGRDGQASEG